MRWQSQSRAACWLRLPNDTNTPGHGEKCSVAQHSREVSQGWSSTVRCATLKPSPNVASRCLVAAWRSALARKNRSAHCTSQSSWAELQFARATSLSAPRMAWLSWTVDRSTRLCGKLLREESAKRKSSGSSGREKPRSRFSISRDGIVRAERHDGYKQALLPAE